MIERLSSGGLELGDHPLVSVVIPTKNRHDSLHRLLASIARQSYPKLEVIIVDDGSETPVRLSRLNVSDVHLIRNEESKGPCFARNQGVEKVRGEFIIFLDDDAEFESQDTISRVINMLARKSDCGAIGFCQLQPDRRIHYMQPASVGYPCYTSVFFGYGFTIRKEAIMRVGAFNPLIGFYYEENEFCLRLTEAGYKIIYDPALSVIHHHDSRGRDSIRMHRLVLRNSIITALLHSPLWCLPPQIMLRLVLFMRLSRAGKKGIDWPGMRWALREVMDSFSIIRRSRKAMRFKTLLYVRRLSRAPVRIY
jgi:GT2 family glycosyltransferase